MENVEDVEDTVDVGDIIVDTEYLREDKLTEENVTRSHLTKIILRILGLSLRITLRIILAMISVPFTGRRATTRQTIGNTKGISQCA